MLSMECVSARGRAANTRDAREHVEETCQGEINSLNGDLPLCTSRRHVIVPSRRHCLVGVARIRMGRFTPPQCCAASMSQMHLKKGRTKKGKSKEGKTSNWELSVGTRASTSWYRSQGERDPSADSLCRVVPGGVCLVRGDTYTAGGRAEVRRWVGSDGSGANGMHWCNGRASGRCGLGPWSPCMCALVVKVHAKVHDT